MNINPDIIEFEKLLKSSIGDSKYFKWHEALLQTQWKIYAVPEDDLILENIIDAAYIMDKVRTFFGSAIIISSWFRSNHYNQFINGSVNSLHKSGLAVDFIVYGMSADQARKKILDHDKLEDWDICMECLPGSKWVHIDLGDPRQNGGRYFKP